MAEGNRRRWLVKRSTVTLCQVLVLAATFVACRNAYSQHSPIAKRAGLKTLDMIVDQDLLASVLKGLIVSEAQVAEINRAFVEYSERVREIDAAGYQRALDTGLREAEELSNPDAIKRRGKLATADYEAFQAEQEQLARRHVELRADYQPHVLAARREADATLEMWLGRLVEIGAANDESVQRVRRLVRRSNMPSWSGHGSEDFARAPDIVDLVEQASADEGEMFHLRGDAEFERALQPILLEFETRVDALVSLQLAESRTPARKDDYKPPISSAENPKEFSDYQRKSCLDWERRTSVSREAATAIAIILPADSATRWTKRFEKAFCPQLMKDRLPDELLTWLENQPDVEPEQVAAARAMRDAWTVRRDEQRRVILTAGLRAKREVVSITAGTFDDVPSLTKYATALYRLHESALEAALQFKTVLNDRQTDVFDADFPGLQIWAEDGRLGPPMDPLIAKHVDPPVHIDAMPRAMRQQIASRSAAASMPATPHTAPDR